MTSTAQSAFVLMVTLVPLSAWAQLAENTAASCRDGMDNDGNGAIDCSDPGCAELIFCHHPSTAAENTATATRTG